MKRLTFIILLSTGLAAQAQHNTVPDKGFWVIESNKNLPKKQTVKFYSADEKLLYQEAYNQKVLNCSRKRIRKILDDVLTAILNTSDTIKTALLANLIRHRS